MINGTSYMGLTDLTFMAFNINAAIDSGRYDMLSIEEVRRAIQDGTVFAYLKNKLGDDIDLSSLDADPMAKAELLAEWQDMEVACEVESKLRIKDRGLPLLFAFLLEGLQLRTQEAA